MATYDSMTKGELVQELERRDTDCSDVGELLEEAGKESAERLKTLLHYVEMSPEALRQLANQKERESKMGPDELRGLAERKERTHPAKPTLREILLWNLTQDKDSLKKLAASKGVSGADSAELIRRLLSREQG